MYTLKIKENIMRYLILLVVAFATLNADCSVETRVDEMEDTTQYVFTCETDGHLFYTFSKSNVPDFKKCYIRLADNKYNQFENMFYIGGMHDYSSYSYQNITLRVDKNKPFYVEADLFNNSQNASFYADADVVEQLENGNRLLVRYINFLEVSKTIEIDISGLKKFTKQDNNETKIEKVTFKKFAFCCKNDFDLHINKTVPDKKHFKESMNEPYHFIRLYIKDNKCLSFDKQTSVEKINSNARYTQIKTEKLGSYWCENGSFK